MKKLISIILAVMLVSALAVTSFAATPLPTVDYVFEDGGYTYVYGSTNATMTEIDAGISIVDIKGKKQFAKFSELDNGEETTKMANSGKFGVKIDANNMLDDVLYIAPYYKYQYQNNTATIPVTVTGFTNKIDLANGIKVAETEGTPLIYSKHSSISSTSKNNVVSGGPYINDVRSLFITFDISSLTATADKYYLDLDTWYNRTYGDSLAANKYVIEIFDTTDNSTYEQQKATWNTTIGDGSIVINEKVGEGTSDEQFYNHHKGSSASNYYTGVRFDITDYIKSVVGKKDKITLYLKASSFEKDPAAGNDFIVFGETKDYNGGTMSIVPTTFAK